MKTLFNTVAVLISALHFVGAPESVAQGSLTPPGAPAPTMKTLQQVEPRIDVATLDNTGDTGSVYVINQAGSYYLSANLAVPSGKNGIHILTGNVTLDLRGFSITGTDSSHVAIVTYTGNVIRNGQIQGNGTGVSLGVNGGNSVVVEDLKIAATIGITDLGDSSSHDLVVRRCEIYALTNGVVANGQVTDCYVSAAGCYAGSGQFTRCTAVGPAFGFTLTGASALTDCRAIGSADGFAVAANCHFTRCTATNVLRTGFLFGNQCSFDQCTFSVATGTASVNGFYGFDGTSYSQNCTFHKCSATGGGGTGSGMTLFAAGAGSTFENCTATGGSTGFLVTGNNSDANGSSASFTNCTATANNAQGFNVGAGCTFNNCSAGINGTFNFTTGDACTLIGCSALGRSTQTGTPVGIHVGSGCTVTNCSAIGHRGDGFQLTSSCLVSGNVSRGNTGNGFHGSGTVNRVDGNLATSNGGAGFLFTTSDYITRNTSFGNTPNYTPSSGTTFGPTGFPSSSTSPWANF